jgi:hypothetical protein
VIHIGLLRVYLELGSIIWTYIIPGTTKVGFLHHKIWFLDESHPIPLGPTLTIPSIKWSWEWGCMQSYFFQIFKKSGWFCELTAKLGEWKGYENRTRACLCYDAHRNDPMCTLQWSWWSRLLLAEGDLSQDLLGTGWQLWWESSKNCKAVKTMAN